jgi:thiamine biosynthesis lipoprotein ApbE
VVAASATDAEAWSKALLLWGERGVGRVERLGATGAVVVAAAGIRRGRRATAARVFEALPARERLAASAEPLR